MKASLIKEMSRIVGLLVLALMAAGVLGSVWPLVVGLAGYIAWSTMQLFALYRWLVREDHTEPPDSSGLWGEFYTRLEHLFQKERRAQDKLEATLQRARQSVNALDDLVILIGPQGNLEYWNRAAERHMGFRAEKDSGQPLTNLIRHPRFIEYLHQADFREPLELPSPVDGNRVLQFRVTSFGVGDQLLMARDVTRVHRLEQMRQDFVANVSHELRTPLTVLKGYLETLLDIVPEEQARLRRALSQMDSQSSRMEALVNDLLLLARLEGTRSDNSREAFNLHALLQRIRHSALTLSADKSHTIDLQVPETVHLLGEPAELESAFGNLITNAVKYTPEGGHIIVHWQQDSRGGRLGVSDDGAGIDRAHLPRLTERFYRPDNSRVTQTGGTGLGLAIVKHVMIRHNGTLDITSELGRGSTFTCCFPVERLADKASPNRR